MARNAKSNRPVHEIRMGRARAAVWENETQNGTRHNVTLSRLSIVNLPCFVAHVGSLGNQPSASAWACVSTVASDGSKSPNVTLSLVEM